MAHWHFRRSPIAWLQFGRGIKRRGNSGQALSIARPPIRFLLAPNWHTWSISDSIWVTYLASKAFPSASPSSPDNDSSRSYCFVEWLKRQKHCQSRTPFRSFCRLWGTNMITVANSRVCTLTENISAITVEGRSFLHTVKVNQEVNQAISQSQARIPWLTYWLTLTRCRKDRTWESYLGRVTDEEKLNKNAHKLIGGIWRNAHVYIQVAQTVILQFKL